MIRVLLATANQGKLRELQALTRESPLAWVALDAFPTIAEPEETGATFAENARLKALYYAEATGLPTLADDSGLEVDALGGRPGVLSARFAGEPRDDLRNNRKLVAELAGVPAERRSARFHCAMAFARDGRVRCESDGVIDGRIIDQPRGRNGFGYDPHFLLPDRGLTTAELDPAEKNRISHRARALQAILPAIEREFRHVNRVE